METDRTQAMSRAVKLYLGGGGRLRLRRRKRYRIGPGGPLRPVHLLRVFLLGVLESNFPGDSL